MGEMGSSYEILKEVDISPHVEKKGNYDYVSWASALDILYSNFPKASYEVHTCQEGHPFFKSELGYYVVVSVTIDDKTETEYHAVTGNNNKALLKPTMVDINTSIKRGLAKAIAQHGLGLDLWIGEDLAQYDKPDTEVTTADKPVEKLASSNGNGKKEPISSLAERKRAWKELTTEAVNRISGTTETEDGNRIDAWKDTVQKKLIELYSQSHQYDRKSVPVEKLEVSQIAHAFKELFPDMVETD